jgi:hypothetical protein
MLNLKKFKCFRETLGGVWYLNEYRMDLMFCQEWSRKGPNAHNGRTVKTEDYGRTKRNNERLATSM